MNKVSKQLQQISRLFIFLMFLLFTGNVIKAQTQPFSVSGRMGVRYEHYGLSKRPPGTYAMPRRPWNQLRFNLQPTLQFSKDFSIPFNFNFVTQPTNFAGPYAGIKSQNLGQFITNPANNFGINPKYKWAELQLGTQYLNYSNLSTGDIGTFGIGFDLRPSIFRVKYFVGSSQRSINYVPPPTAPPGTPGAFERNHWMTQFGVEKEGNYRFLVNAVHGEDRSATLVSWPPLVQPQENFNYSLIADKYFNKGWYIRTEAAQSYYTKNKNTPATYVKDLTLSPFIFSRASTQKDYAGEASIGKKSEKFDLSYTSKYIGAGFQTMGFPYLQPDHWDNTLNTRFTAWQNKMNVVASAGLRKNNVNNTSLKSNQFIGNINWFTQFSERFSLNANYNNFGFTAPSGFNPFGIKNVSNDFGITPTYIWSNEKKVNILTFSYNYSKYDERDVFTGFTTSNNTHTVLLSYLPTYLQKEIAPEFNVLYFHNSMPSFKNNLLTLTAGAGFPALQKKMQLKALMQYTLGKLNNFTSNHNFIPSFNIDYKASKKLTWSTFLTTNYFKYGDELGMALTGARYIETTSRTGLLYKF
ncbi:MAG TPA: hypothetical protein VM368_02240 [Flavisolibacter sp.]|nr:hypothetical protein [Flavisolibacter sp.]